MSLQARSARQSSAHRTGEWIASPVRRTRNRGKCGFPRNDGENVDSLTMTE